MPANSTRQAAHRARDKSQWVELPRDAHKAHSDRLDALQQAIGEAAKQGDEMAKSCRAANVDAMLEKLTTWFESRAA
jgi:hypothetical protein